MLPVRQKHDIDLIDHQFKHMISPHTMNAKLVRWETWGDATKNTREMTNHATHHMSAKADIVLFGTFHLLARMVMSQKMLKQLISPKNKAHIATMNVSVDLMVLHMSYAVANQCGMFVSQDLIRCIWIEHLIRACLCSSLAAAIS